MGERWWVRMVEVEGIRNGKVVGICGKSQENGVNGVGSEMGTVKDGSTCTLAASRPLFKLEKLSLPVPGLT